jgi:hypothetical protein
LEGEPIMAMGSRLLPTSIMVLASALGGLAMLTFGAFLFVGPVHSLHLRLSPGAAVAWNALLSVLFFAQHSGMARRAFRSRLSARIPCHYHPALFAIVAGVALLAVVVFWQPSRITLYELRGLPRWLARGCSWSGSAGSRGACWRYAPSIRSARVTSGPICAANSPDSSPSSCVARTCG